MRTGKIVVKEMREKGRTDLEIRAVASQLCNEVKSEILEALQEKPEKLQLSQYVCMDPFCGGMNFRCNWDRMKPKCIQCESTNVQIVVMEATKDEYKQREREVCGEAG